MLNQDSNFENTEKVVSIQILAAKEESDLFTIAIPTFKRSNLLKESIDSALSQINISNYTVLIVDNNPERDDETEKLLLTYQDSRISYYKNTQNLGMTGNWNKLYSLAKSKYVVMLHDDDLLFPNYLSVLSRVILETKYSYSAYFTSFIFFDMNKSSKVPAQSIDRLIIRKIKETDFLQGNIIGPPVGLCLDREVVKQIGGFSSRYYPSLDFDFYVKISHHHRVCKIEGFPLTIYRIGENESCKTETLLAFIKCDIDIKKNIIANNNFFIKRIWNSYNKVFALDYLERMKSLYNNQEFESKVELKKMGIACNPYDKGIYKMMNYYFRLRRRIVNSCECKKGLYID